MNDIPTIIAGPPAATRIVLDNIRETSDVMMESHICLCLPGKVHEGKLRAMAWGRQEKKNMSRVNIHFFQSGNHLFKTADCCIISKVPLPFPVC
jgi:hypothetical protein